MSTYNPNLTQSLHEAAGNRKPAEHQDPERVAARRTTPAVFAQTALLHYEDPAEFEALRDAYLDEHLPATPTESFFINEMANAQWRLRRLRLIEADLIRVRLSTDPALDDSAAQAEAVRLAADTTKALHFLLRQESALRRQYERSLKMFWECRRQQQKRKDAEAKAEKLEKQKLTKQTQSSPELVTFMKRVSEFCSAPPPLPPAPPFSQAGSQPVTRPDAAPRL